jgi:hypothetical protein
MNWQETLSQLSKTGNNREQFYSTECLPYELRVTYDDINFDELNTRLAEYWVHTWLCSDTWVGYMALFLDDELVAISYQSARKSPKNYKYVSKEMLKKARMWVIDCIEIDADTEEGSFLQDGWEKEQTKFTCEYTCQILTRQGYIIQDGEQVPVTAKSKDRGTSQKLVIVVDATGEELTIPTNQYFHNPR